MVVHVCIYVCIVESPDERCEKVLLYWSPELCAMEQGVEDTSVPVMSATTYVRSILAIIRC